MARGRPKGALNKVTRELKEQAREYTTDALNTLEAVMKGSDSDAARVAAAKELLDRGHGRAVQGIEHKGHDGGPLVVTWLPPQ